MQRIPVNPIVAVVGAGGVVGGQLIKTLVERQFPWQQLRLLATPRSAGKEITVRGKPIVIEAVTDRSLSDVDVALFAAGSTASRNLIPGAARGGTICIDKSSAFRMDPEVPLVVPEVNRTVLREHKNIIASPNCTTSQLVVAIKPIHDAARITRVTVSSYQAVSGTGRDAVHELIRQTQTWAGKVSEHTTGTALEDELPEIWHEPECVYPLPIFGNALPHIDLFGEEGYTEEEWKLVHETRKIMGVSDLPVAATCVRIPVYIGHSLVVQLETERRMCASKIREILQHAEGVIVVDDPAQSAYPTPLLSTGHDQVFVGRIREDISCDRGVIMWVVSDNLRKGAATNAVQIAEDLLDR